MIEIDKRIINVFEDISNFKGIDVHTDRGIESIDLTKEEHLPVYENGDADAWIFPYIFTKGIKEGWLKIEVDETNPKNKLSYINKLLKKYGEEV